MSEAMHPDGQPDGHRRPRRGSQLGHKSEIALLLIADAGGQQVHLNDLPAQDRRFVNSKAVVLEQMALITSHGSVGDSSASGGRPMYSLTELGRTTVELLRAAAGA